MGKGIALLLSVFCLSELTQAQIDTLSVLQQRAQNENADFTFTESQLGDDEDAGEAISAISGIQNDLYRYVQSVPGLSGGRGGFPAGADQPRQL